MTLVWDELIICTRGRPSETLRCLEATVRNTEIPASIHVVDSSTDDRTELIVRDFESSHQSVRIRYSRTDPGLTKQRNFGIRASHAEIVHFLDDDSVVDPRYFEAIRRAFASHARVLGVSGFITNNPRSAPSRLSRIFLLSSRQGGRVLASGRNVWVYEEEGPLYREVEWLTGCSMSYRRRAFEKRSFAEELGGYALGEDVEFSYRLAPGSLLVAMDARVAHLQSEHNRWSRDRYIATEVLHRFNRVMAHRGRLSLTAFAWSLFGQVSSHLTKAVLRRDSQEWRNFLATMTGIRLVAYEVVSRRGQNSLGN